MEPLIKNLSRATIYCFQYPFENAQPFIHQYVDNLLPVSEIEPIIYRAGFHWTKNAKFEVGLLYE